MFAPDFNGKRDTSAPARQFGWQGRAGRGLPRRTGMRRDLLTNALLGRVSEVVITVWSSTFGVGMASPHGQSVQHKTGHEGQNHNQ